MRHCSEHYNVTRIGEMNIFELMYFHVIIELLAFRRRVLKPLKAHLISAAAIYPQRARVTLKIFGYRLYIWLSLATDEPKRYPM